MLSFVASPPHSRLPSADRCVRGRSALSVLRMPIRQLLALIAANPVDATSIGNQCGIDPAAVNATLVRLARLGVTMLVGGWHWQLATDELDAALELAAEKGVDLDEEVEAYARRPSLKPAPLR